MKQLTVGLIGNPNSGKTTLFNQLTGSKQRVGNWSGVTVEKKEGVFLTANQQVTLVDLPGVYSLTTISEHASIDEQIACHYILSDQADLLLNVIDASNLERGLYLTLQLLGLGVPCIVVLNMLDIASKQQIQIDFSELSARLGCPVIPMVSTRSEGLEELKQVIDHHFYTYLPTLVKYPVDLHQAIQELMAAMSVDLTEKRRYWLALQMLEGDIYSAAVAGEQAQHMLSVLKREYLSVDDPALLIADARYQSIAAICSAVSDSVTIKPNILTQFIDQIVLNRWLGIPIFLCVMYLMFILAINVGGALQPLFEEASSALFIDGIQWLGFTFAFPDWLTIFLAQGVGGGINTLLSLVPQIGIMYLFLSFLEDSGYMARAAFVIDRLMQVLGLPGKSFVPLIVGFGCNVPAIMGARTLDTPRERLITIMMAPFMSCGARLAIFVVFSAAFFGNHGALIIFSLYLLGLIVALLTGLLLKHTVMRGEASPFVMELPVYHIPHLKSLLLQTWQRLKGFIIRAGKVIIAASMIIGALNSFSFSGKSVDNINQSALATVGKVITPLLQPIGVTVDNWQATVGLISGTVAKEVVIGTLNTLYTAEQINEAPFDYHNFDLLEKLQGAVAMTGDKLKETLTLQALLHPIEASQDQEKMDEGAMGVMGSKFGSIAAAYSYLIFVLLYVPCISVIGAIAREANRRWMMFSIFWGTNVAYSISTLFYQAVFFQQHPLYSTVAISLVFTVNAAIFFVLRRINSGVWALQESRTCSRHSTENRECH